MNEQSKLRPIPAAEMIGTVEIKKIGNSSELFSRRMCWLGCMSASAISFYATLTPDGGFRLTPYDPSISKRRWKSRGGA